MTVVDVVSDVVCPWCYIGKRKLETALARLREREPETEVAVRWHAFQLNPDLPREGIARSAYLEAKFGRARADEVYARVTRAGADVGIGFEFARIERQPNTVDAHRLIAWAQSQGDAGSLVDRLFAAYFTEGRMIGDRKELARLAADCGFAAADVRAFLESDALRAEVEAEDREARDVGVSGVPFFIFEGRTAVSGAHEPETLLEALAEARGKS